MNANTYPVTIINYFEEKYSKIINNIQKKKKIDNNEIIRINSFNDYDKLIEYNLSVNQLKTYCKQFKLKTSGTKNELLTRLYTYLFLSNNVINIQKIVRGYLIRKYIYAHGPAFKNKNLCVNQTDFLTMDELTNISYNQFFSFKDSDNFIYGFDLISFSNLIYKSNGAIKNPYNRLNISNNIITNFRDLLRLSKVLNIDVITKIENVLNEVSTIKSLELRVLTLFQKMDELGNYTNYNWFMTLNNQQLIKLLRELMDVWNYRSPLTEEVRLKICPPNGKPFGRLSSHGLVNITNIDELRKIVLEILEKFVFSGIDNDSKCLGTYYVLGCLTLVNEDATTALPWLYQAFAYM
jgi:hypothetical protein